jgi:hypothetical protein
MENNITDTSKLRAIIVSSFIMELLRHLGKEDAHKLSVIRFRQLISSKLCKEPKGYAEISNRAWKNGTVDVAEKNYKYSISTIIESVYYNALNDMHKYLGVDSELMLGRMMMKLPAYKDGVKHSYELADALNKAVEKEVYSYIKEQG